LVINHITRIILQLFNESSFYVGQWKTDAKTMYSDLHAEASLPCHVVSSKSPLALAGFQFTAEFLATI
jgi:hypothetical protein